MKDAKGHGSNARGNAMPIPGHDYHTKTDAQLRYIAKDAGEAERNVRSFDQQAASKYSDQIANAASVLGYRARGGAQVVKDIAAQHGISTDHLDPAGDYSQSRSTPMRTPTRNQLHRAMVSMQSPPNWPGRK